MDINQIVQSSMAAKHGQPPINNDFFKPLNEMDPLVRKASAKKYSFDCNYYNLALTAHREEYKKIINKCLTGELIQGLKETNFTKEGELIVYLEWIIPADGTADADAEPKNKKFDDIEPEDTSKNKATKKTKGKPKKTRKKKVVKNHHSTDPTLPFDLEDDPTKGLASLANLEVNKDDL